MASNRLSYRSAGAVLAFLIAVYLLSSHVSLLQSVLWQSFSLQSKDQPVKSRGSNPSPSELESAFNIRSDNAWDLTDLVGWLPGHGHWNDAFRSFAIDQVPHPEFINGRSAEQFKEFNNNEGRIVRVSSS
ncbi:MAG: hypothetical protein Q9166_007559 [cf. Caloplaca sp. 2 TL-2023]